MPSLMENDGCKYALTDPPAPNRHPFGHAIGPSYPHDFCGEPTIGDGVYCQAHHDLCRRGLGKDVRSLEQMIHAIDRSVSQVRPSYSEHTDPIDVELQREGASS